jgi:NAD-dependent dihydropyrimidine dehydrogenase PreA subunit
MGLLFDLLQFVPTDCAKMNKLQLPVIDSTRCNGAMLCVEACPTDAIGVVDGKCFLVAPERCEYCRACEDVCPQDAISLPLLIVFSRANQERP